MTKETLPEALALADQLQRDWENEKFTMFTCAGTAVRALRAQHARIAELEAELAALKAAPAGVAPVQADMVIPISQQYQQVAPVQAAGAAQSVEPDLYAAIMNIPIGKHGQAMGMAYMEGHRDARHAAAELVIAAQAAQGSE